MLMVMSMVLVLNDNDVTYFVDDLLEPAQQIMMDAMMIHTCTTTITNNTEMVMPS
jgi:hypothetical protein